MNFQELIKKGYIENDPEAAIETELAGYWMEAGDYRLIVRPPQGGGDEPLVSIQEYEDGVIMVITEAGSDHFGEYTFKDNDIPVSVYKLVERST